jgi:ribosome biogenesis GTPase / thiamine phosphate phosphatase
LAGKITAFAGPSGVGKSSLLNRIIPELEERTGDISAATGKGKHTTTWTTLFQIDKNTFVADTPGMRQLGLYGIDYDHLDELFPEFRPYLDECYYADCRHMDEPDCAVLKAVEAGKIHPDRYDSYRRLVSGDAE